jgi:hypothetical protein
MPSVPDTQENMSRCICGGCPSFPGQGGFFCAKGKSALPVTQRGCVCGDCENFKAFGLQDGYYCVAGRAGEGAK